jgi:flavin-dependent dehydrogenase
MLKSIEVDVVIYGAGPAGIIAALKLVQEGKKVAVIEKQNFPRFVIGESLLPYCMEFFEKLDLIDDLNAVGFQKKYGAIFHNGQNAECRFNFSEQYTKGYSYTWQVKRADFDLKLSQIAVDRGVQIYFDHSVVEVEMERDRQKTLVINSKEETKEVFSKFVIDGSGYGRVLPKLLGLEKPSSLGLRGAIFGHLNEIRKPDEYSNFIIATSFNDNLNWSWSIPLKDDICSVGIVGDMNMLNKMKEEDFKLFKAHFTNQSRFENANWSINPKSIEAYSVGVKQMHGEGYALCGNATEFLDPIFSSGVTLAVASGFKAAELAVKQLDNEQVDWQEDYENVISYGTEVFKSYVASWYNGDLQKIFYAKSVNEDIRKQICSVLAGYVWDKSNPFVKKHKSILTTLSKVIDIDTRKPNA